MTWSLECPDGETATGAAAEQLLAKWLRTSFRDFGTIVYQHQETIRGIVTQEPKERSDAIDRLLGLSDFRNILSGVAQVNVNGYQNDFGKKCDGFDERVRGMITTGQQYLEQSRCDAEASGVPRIRLTDVTALDIAGRVLKSLLDFVTEIGLKSSAVDLPARWEDLRILEMAVQAEIQHLRGALPDQGEQNQLCQRQNAVRSRSGGYGDAKGRQDEIGRKGRDLDKIHNGRSRVNARMAEIDEALRKLEAKQEEISGRQQVIVKAVEYLEESRPDETDRCPVCEKETEGLLVTLRKKLEGALREKLDESKRDTAKLKDERVALNKVAEEYQTLDAKLRKLITDKEDLDRQVGELFKRELTKDDDPVALLNSEDERINRRLEELDKLIGARQVRLNKLDDELTKLRRVREVLQLSEKQRVIESIKESPEYAELNNERDRLAEFVNDVESIKHAVAAASRDDASRKLDDAAHTIDKFFRELTGNPAVTKISLAINLQR